MADEITRQVYAPNTAANSCARWAAEVRERGWIMNAAYFNTKAEAEAWLKTASHKMTREVAEWYREIMRDKLREAGTGKA